ncbi:sialidase family protein [Haloferula rosea]|uniref:exo-alpha-sialidase n=1 Tax=Haloferula rosea TaxID=490093 RepID=A0A934RCR5_9BACT|nr:sialidase family protein [Haloferula rosea]MBK1826646.1 exo-alpha-sialidase [Haloferula rosea]
MFPSLSSCCPPLLQTACWIVLSSLLSHAADRTWQQPGPLRDQSQEVQAPLRVLDGPFSVEANLTLDRLSGSASSVRFGKQLNFGFNGHKGTLFAEGPAIGNIRLLEPTSKFIKPGEPFLFHAERTDDDSFTVSINHQEVFTMKNLRGPLETIAIRPMRSRAQVHRFRVSGSLDIMQPGLHARHRTTPLLTDGEAHPVLTFILVLDEERVLNQIDIDCHGDLPTERLHSLELIHQGKPVMTHMTSTGLSGTVRLPQGRHSLELQAAVQPGTDTRDALTLSCTAVRFADGSIFKLQPAEPSTIRLAYPIHKQGQFDCHTFRIPAIARAKDGSLLAVYDMRYNSRRDLQEHMDIGLSRSTDGGITWADPVPIMDMGEWGGKPQKENGCSDPGILVDEETGEVFVTAMWTHGKPGTHQWTGNGSEPGHDIHRSSQFMMIRSKDHGVTWSPPENLTETLKDPAWYLFAPAPGNGITMKDGTLVMPTQGRDAEGRPFSNITWSKDRGATWTVSTHARDNTTECAVAELSDGSLLLNMRDNRNHRDKSETNGRAMGVTKDLGKTWTVHSADHGALPEPTCMASMISHILEDGRHVLIFSNPRNRHARKDMTIQLSFDDGVTWPEAHRLVLDEEGGAYSSLVMIDDQTLGILYESSQADLVFQRIPLSELLR